MNTGIIGVICVAFILIGSLLGFMRGWKNSLIRFVEVLFCAFVAYFLAGSLAEAVMSVDLSSFGATIAGVTVSTVEQTLTELIGSIGGVSELMKASPTLNALFAIVPILIVSMILFVLIFFVAKFLVWIIHAIAGSVIRKKLKERDDYDDEDAGKKIVKRLIGLLVGFFQGVLCFAVVMLPIAGTTYFLADEVKYIRQYQDGTLVEDSAVASVYASEDSAKDELGDAEKSLNEINAKFRVLALFGYKSISTNVVEGLTSFELNGVETSLTAEVNNIVKVYVRVDDLLDTPVDKWTEEEIMTGREVVELFFASPITGDITTELIKNVADSWTSENKDETLLIYFKPEIKDESGQKVFDVFLKQLKANTKEDMKSEFNSIVSIFEVAVKNDIINVVKTSTTIEDVMQPLAKDGVATDIIGAMAEGRAVKNTLPTIVQFGLDQFYPMLGVSEEDSRNLQVLKASSEINWETEKVYLGNTFAGFARTYISLQGEGSVLGKIDYDSLAFSLENLRCSQLLNSRQENGNTLAKEITLAIINSSYLQSVDGVDGILNSIESDYETINFESIFETVEASIAVADSVSKVNNGELQEIPSKEVAELLNGLTDPTTGKLVKDLVGKNNLTGLGVDDSSANAVGSLVGAVVDYNAEAEEVGAGSVKMPTEQAEIDNATDAFISLVDVVQSGNENVEAQENKFFESKEEMRDFILDLKKSPYVYQIAMSQSETLGFKDSLGYTKLTDTEYGYLLELIAEDESTFSHTEMSKLFGVKI